MLCSSCKCAGRSCTAMRWVIACIILHLVSRSMHAHGLVTRPMQHVLCWAAFVQDKARPNLCLAGKDKTKCHGNAVLKLAHLGCVA